MKPAAGAAILAASFVVAWAVTNRLTRFLQSRGILDVPNARSSHRTPTPRGGGIGIIAGLVAGSIAGLFLGLKLPGRDLIFGVLVVAFAGALDDYFGGISVFVRLGLQSVAAGLVVFSAGGLPRLPLPEPLAIPLGLLGIPVALIWLVGVTNVFNFLDGIDGFAATQGLVAGLAVAVLYPGSAAAVIGVALVGGCAGFLVHNWYPARIFMGDVGSGVLGFILAALPFELAPAMRGRAVFVVAMCLWFFLADGLFTIARRLLRGEKVWQAHRSHLYQRLVRTGLRHDEVVLRVCALAATVTVLAVAAGRVESAPLDWMTLGVAVGCFWLYCSWTWRREARWMPAPGGLSGGKSDALRIGSEARAQGMSRDDGR